jgi:transposase
MQTALEELSKEEVIAAFRRLEQEKDRQAIRQAEEVRAQKQEIDLHKQEIDLLKAQLEKLRRMQFGQKRERFIDPDQQSLPFEAPVTEQQEEALEQQITYVRKRQFIQKLRAALPAHLPVETVEIYPEGDLSEMVCIGSDITEELDCEPARFFIRRYVRYKYTTKEGEGVTIGQLPERVIDKGIPGAGLLASILTDKYMDHLPLYRQKQRFARENIPIASSTIEGWTKQALERLEPLYKCLEEDTRAQGYLQVDESPIKVLDSDKKGAAHQGWYWVYHAPWDNTVFFHYQPSRAKAAVLPMLEKFEGYLQTDGYAVYQSIGSRKDVTHLACWAHARREFERALDNDKTRAAYALNLIQRLYATERKAKEYQLTTPQIKELRLNESLPVINELGKWISQQIKQVLPQSAIGKALNYSQQRWDMLSAYLHDGSLHIDNNGVENAIRPLALGRKNYLFAGSHEAATRAGMIYSFFASCKKHDVNPYQWLKHALLNIMAINHKNIKELYPQNFKKIAEQS